MLKPLTYTPFTTGELRPAGWLKKQLEIEQNDERNIAVAKRAKGKAFDCMTYVYSALMLSFALMGVDLVPLLLLVFAYLLVHGVALYYRVKFEKEM